MQVQPRAGTFCGFPTFITSPRLGANHLRYLVIVFDSPVHELVNWSSPRDLDHKTQKGGDQLKPVVPSLLDDGDVDDPESAPYGV